MYIVAYILEYPINEIWAFFLEKAVELKSLFISVLLLIFLQL